MNLNNSMELFYHLYMLSFSQWQFLRTFSKISLFVSWTLYLLLLFFQHIILVLDISSMKNCFSPPCILQLLHESSSKKWLSLKAFITHWAHGKLVYLFFSLVKRCLYFCVGVEYWRIYCDPKRIIKGYCLLYFSKNNIQLLPNIWLL